MTKSYLLTTRELKVVCRSLQLYIKENEGIDEAIELVIADTLLNDLLKDIEQQSHEPMVEQYLANKKDEETDEDELPF